MHLLLVCVLFFLKKDIKTKTKTYISETLTEIEKRYSEIAREDSATAFGCMKVEL